jgi:hypothetical protein
MVLKRNLLGWRFEEYWFDEPGYLASSADIVALRSHAPARLSHCRIPERTLLVPLDPPEAAILEGFAARARHSVRQALKTVRVELAAAPADRASFYAAYLPFAAEKGLLSPDPAEESELEILLARNAEGELLQGAAFLPARAAGIYRYRYGVYVRKSQANAALVYEAMRRAKALGFSRFDMGGISPGARPGSAEAGINFFKSQFGGVETESALYLRGSRFSTRLLLRAAETLRLPPLMHAAAALAARRARK